MRKWISYGFIWLSAILLLGHSLVPHVHEYSQVVSITGQSCHAESEFGLLGKLFSLDIGGENHLENFLSIHQKTVDFSTKEHFISTVNYFLVDGLIAYSRNCNHQKIPDYRESEKVDFSRLFYQKLPLRAPPITA